MPSPAQAPDDRLVDWLGSMARSDRIILGVFLGCSLGFAFLLLGVLRAVFALFSTSTGIGGGLRGALSGIAAVAIPYVATFAVAGVALGLLAGLRRTWYSYPIAGFVLGTLIYGGIALTDPTAAGTFTSRLKDAWDFGKLMGGAWALIGLTLYGVDRLRSHRARVV